MMSKITSLSRNAIGMPLVGFGTYQMSVDQAEKSVLEALKAGFRHIDSAQGYQNEVGTGKGLSEAIKTGVCKREEIFVTTKLMPGYSGWGAPEVDYEGTISACKNSLKELQLDYCDLYLIHAPLSSTRIEQYRALVELKKLGLAKYIGVSNYNEDRLKEIKDAGLPMPDANQLEFHPVCAQAKMTPIMKEMGIVPVAYSSLATLSTWRTKEGQGGEVKADTKTKCQEVQKDIATRLGVSEAKLLLRWGLQRGYAVLTKSTNPKRMKDNIDLFDFEISEDDMEQLNAQDLGEYIAWSQQGIEPQEVNVPLAQ